MAENEKKLKHLEFLQNVITRMNTNSFLIKGWEVTLISAIFAIALDRSNAKLVPIAYVPVCLFWILDGFFVSQERQYRCMYKEVASKSEDQINFSMDATPWNDEDRTWFSGFISKTICPFHAILLLVVSLVFFWSR